MTLSNVFEEIESANTPPEATVIRRASSYSDFYHVVQAQLSKDAKSKRKVVDKKNRTWEALMLPKSKDEVERQDQKDLSLYDDQLLDASQQEYLYAVPLGHGMDLY